MKHFIAAIIASFMVTLTANPPAFAADRDAALTEDAARRFVDSLEDIDPIADEINANPEFEAAFDPVPALGKPFAPYTTGLAVMKDQMPDLHQRVTAIAKKHGFKPAQWASAGDKVLLAYLATEVDGQQMDMAEIKAMDPAMLDQAPPQMRAQIERIFAMIEAVENVPDADKAAIRPVMQQLEKYMAE